MIYFSEENTQKEAERHQLHATNKEQGFRKLASQTQIFKQTGNVGKESQNALAKSKASSNSEDEDFHTPVTMPSRHMAFEGLSKLQHKSV